MNKRHLRSFILYLFIVLPVSGSVLRVHKRDWIDSPPPGLAEGDVECFSEYMELWIHRMRIEGLRLWLSAVLNTRVTFTSLENLNHQLSACGFGLHKDPDRNYIFRVTYSGCFVQREHGHYVIALNLMKRISRFGGRTQNYVMKCPVVVAPPNREYIKCDTEFIQVTREIPLDSWNKQLTWSLALRGSLVVALEDASLIQVSVDIQKPQITVQGRRNTVLSPLQVLQTEGQFLPLKLVSGHYAYSMEATCPNVIQDSSEDTVLHIYKRRMGLTKRGGCDNETLTVSSVTVNQTDVFTWSETSSFVQLIIPSAQIQTTENCADEEGGILQHYVYRIDVVLTFKETNNRMLWRLENTSPCLYLHNISVETELHPAMMPKPPQTGHTTSKLTFPHSESIVGPLLTTEASRMDPQTSLQTTKQGFSITLKPSQVYPATEIVSSAPPQSSSSPETNATRLLNNTISLLVHTDKPNEQIAISHHLNAEPLENVLPAVSTYVTNEASIQSNPTPSLSSSSLSAHPDRLMDLARAGETSPVTSDGPSSLITDSRMNTTTDSNINTADLFTAAPSHTRQSNTVFKRNLIASSSSERITVTNTGSDTLSLSP